MVHILNADRKGYGAAVFSCILNTGIIDKLKGKRFAAAGRLRRIYCEDCITLFNGAPFCFHVIGKRCAFNCFYGKFLFTIRLFLATLTFSADMVTSLPRVTEEGIVTI